VTLFKVDKKMHGMQLGAEGMANQIQTWAEEEFLFRLIFVLRAKGFDVFMSSDHGNTEAIGIGLPQEGVLSDKGGERCRIYSDPLLTNTCLKAFPQALSWRNSSLPDNLAVLLAPYGKSFATVGKKSLSHGGPSIEEVCVPFLRIRA
jgi:hypothetical protein